MTSAAQTTQRERMSLDPIVSIKNMDKLFGDFVALEDINIDIYPGEIFALLGPSGCGKSTLLRIISGFESQTSGDLMLDGEEMSHLPPNKRPTNMVFQSYAVFPHMNVEKNVAYGLKMDKLSKAEISIKVDEALKQVHLTDFRKRMPDQLSGGQRQRVALARALVKRPRVLLLDEPLSALDAKLRDAMRLELVKLQESVGITFVIVTHDQSEALAMADRVAVLDKGKLRQVAAPDELYQRPVDAFVADFIGNINFFKTDELTSAPNHTSHEILAIRPEQVSVSLSQVDEGIVLKGKLGDVAFQGQNSIVEIILPSGKTMTSLVNPSVTKTLLAASQGDDIWASWSGEQMLVLPKNGFEV